MRHGGTGFLLQASGEPDFSRHFQRHLRVENVDDRHAQVLSSGVASQFGVAVGVPHDRPWGMRDFTLLDPSGVLWRVAQHPTPAPQTGRAGRENLSAAAPP